MKLKSIVSISTLLALYSVGYAAPARADHEPSQPKGALHGACEVPARDAAFTRALEYERSHETTPWSDRSMNAAGEIIVQRTYEENGQFCRDYIDRCRVGESEYVTGAKACRVGFETWQVVEVFFTEVEDPSVSTPPTRYEPARVTPDTFERPPPAPAPLPSGAGPAFDVAEVQRSLVVLGYDPGPVDGVKGPKTVAAINAFARARDIQGTWRSNPDLPAAIVQEAASVERDAAPTVLIGYADPYRYKKRGEGFHAPLGYIDEAVEPGVYRVSFYGGGGGWKGPSEARTIENMLTRALEICTQQGSYGYELLESPSGQLISTGTWRTSLGGELPVASAYVSCCDGVEAGYCTTSVASDAALAAGEPYVDDAPSTASQRWRPPVDPYPIAGR